MTVIVDANIVISAIINPKGIIPFLLFNSNDKIEFVVPSFIIEEIELHKSKIIAAADISNSAFNSLLNSIKQNLFIFSDEMIDDACLAKALVLTKHVDKKDTIYVAFSIALDALFWTVTIN